MSKKNRKMSLRQLASSLYKKRKIITSLNQAKLLKSFINQSSELRIVRLVGRKGDRTLMAKVEFVKKEEAKDAENISTKRS